MSKRSRRHAQIRPNERFYMVHEMLGRLGGMTFDMLHRLAWQGRKGQTCRDKLDQWERSGTLEKMHREVHGKAVTLYVLTEKGRKMLPDNVQPHLYQSPPTENETNHVLRFGEFLFSLGSELSSFVNERELRIRNWQREEEERDPEVTDGYVEIGERGAYIEIDSGDSGARLAAKCAGLAASGKPTRYLVYSKARLRTVTQALQKARAANVHITFVQVQQS
ncbi:MAG: replication-relaxation family protein [Ktedonobacteraceae bacterium]